MNVPDVYELAYEQSDKAIVTEYHMDLLDVLKSLRGYRQLATDHHVSITKITITPVYLDQAPIPGLVR